MRIAFTLLLFAGGILNAQEFYILNEVDKSSVPNAHIDYLNGAGTTSDSKGKFILKGTIDSIKITSLGFKPLTIKLSNIYPQNKILLQENAITLDEVSMFNKKVKLLKHKKPFKPKFKFRDFTDNERVITFIPFPEIKNNSILIKNIVVNTTGFLDKERRYYPFKVNLYKVSTKYKPPLLKDSLLTGILTSRKTGEPSLIRINMEEQEILLPSEGIYASFETLDESYYPKDSVYLYTKRFGWQYWQKYTAPVVKTIQKNIKKTISYSYRMVRRRYNELNGEEINEDYWQLEKDFIYDITLEVEY